MFDDMNREARVQSNLATNTIDLYLFQTVGQVRQYACSPAMVNVVQGAYMYPAFQMGMSGAQKLMDDLWNAGIRPVDVKSKVSDNQTDMARHLQDMRALAFGSIKLNGQVTP